MRSPFISIIVPVLNGADTIESCLESVFSQSYTGWELVVIDGGSTDCTTDILRSHENKISYWSSELDHSIAHAWNKGLSAVGGEWIYFLGCDDRLYEGKVLETASSYLEKAGAEHIKLVYGRVNIVDSQGRTIETKGGPWTGVRETFFTKGMAIPHQGSFHSCELFNKYGKFDESFKIGADYEMLLRCLKKEKPLYMPDVIVANMSDRGLSNTAASLINVFREQITARKKNGLSTPFFWRLAQLTGLYTAAAARRLFGDRTGNRLLDLYRMLLTGKPPKWS